MIIHRKRTPVPGLILLTLAPLILSALYCGPKPGVGTSGSSIRSISGYIYVTEISGRLGTKVMSHPGSIALDHIGNLVICDTGNNRLIKVKPDGTFLTEVGGFGFAREQFNYPADLATPDGVNFYLLDSENDRIIRLDYDLNWIAEEQLADVVIEPPLGRCSGVAVNSFGDIFLSDPDNNRVVRLDLRLMVTSELNGPDGFLDPGAVTIDQNGSLLVVDRDRKLITLFDSYDNYLGSFESVGAKRPSDICKDENDLLYVVDAGTNAVRIIASDGDEIYALGSSGTGEYRFRQAHSICVNREGWLFVSDYIGDGVMVYRPNRP